jgi:hypothetical protein
MSDFYPSIHSDKNLTQMHLDSLKKGEDKQRSDKERQFERMVIVQRKIKRYAKYEKAQKL